MHWKVTGTNLYLIGAVHAAEAPLEPDKQCSQLLAAAQVVAFEVDLAAPVTLKAGEYQGQGTLSGAISPDLLEDARALWETLGISVVLESLKPWAAAIVTMGAIVPTWGFDFINGLDRAIAAQAVELASCIAPDVGAFGLAGSRVEHGACARRSAR